MELNSDASYLLAGGIGGLGRGLAHYMAGLGCKNLIMVSRSAEQYEAAPDLVKKLARMGCNALVLNCNVADPTDLTTLLDTLRDARVSPIKGVIQAAMVLKVSEHH